MRKLPLSRIAICLSDTLGWFLFDQKPLNIFIYGIKLLYRDFVYNPPDDRSLKIRRPLCGVGVNDANYQVKTKINGSYVVCKIYILWRNMISRCYNQVVQRNQPTYIGCSVDKRWHSFMAFREWVLSQPEWEECQLDKDLLVSGNKIYGPNTCLFVPRTVNSFLTENRVNNNKDHIGIRLGSNGFYSAQVRYGKNNRWISGEIFDLELASLVYDEKKLQIAELLSFHQSNPMVASALISRYS